MMQKVVQHDLKIKGMTCNSCEMRIENALVNLDGIFEIKAYLSGLL